MSYGSVLLTRIVGKSLWLNSDFEALDNIEKASFVLGCELWILVCFSLSPWVRIRGMAL